MKIIIYGNGKHYDTWKHRLPESADIVGYLDSKPEMRTSFSGKLVNGKKMFALYELNLCEYDYVYICATYIHDMYRGLTAYGVEPSKIRTIPVQTPIGDMQITGITLDTMKVEVGNISFFIQKYVDFATLLEVFMSGMYNMSLMKQNYIFIDVGMNVGYVSILYAGNTHVEKVYSYEPFEDTYLAALDNINGNESIKEKIIPLQFALSDTNEERLIECVEEKSAWRSINNNSSPNRKSKNTFMISVKDAGDEINNIFEKHTNNPAILKIDTEGSELEIIRSLDKRNLVSRFDIVMLEYHNDPTEIVDILIKNDFQMKLPGYRDRFGMIYAFKN